MLSYILGLRCTAGKDSMPSIGLDLPRLIAVVTKSQLSFCDLSSPILLDSLETEILITSLKDPNDFSNIDMAATSSTSADTKIGSPVKHLENLNADLNTHVDGNTLLANKDDEIQRLSDPSIGPSDSLT